MTVNRRLVLAERPSGLVGPTTVVLEEAEVPELEEGQALIRVEYLSIDPTIRTWMDDVVGYLAPIALGEVVRSVGIGTVVRSRSADLAAGATVLGLFGWQDWALAGAGAAEATPVPAGLDPPTVLHVFGVTGMTAYFGLLEVGGLREGDTVVVSAAAGATGSMVGQIARLRGAGRVIGLAGTDEKCRHVVEDLGFDAAVNYRTEAVGRRLGELCPGGIDLYFDNVGGEILDACLGLLALRGRVVLCGAIAAYNDPGRPPGPANYVNLIPRRGRMEGFIILDYAGRFAEAQAAVATWLIEGRLHHREEVVHGLERAPEALNLLFAGANTGKVVVAL